MASREYEAKYDASLSRDTRFPAGPTGQPPRAPPHSVCAASSAAAPCPVAPPPLGPLLGLPPKERWPLVADAVDGKDKKECASHYKLQQILEREAAERDDTARRRGEEPW